MYGQEKVSGSSVYDVDSLLLFSFYSNDSIIYTDTHGKVMLADNKVEFMYGADSLSWHVFSTYCKSPLYDGNDYRLLVPYCILFDNELNMIEIRLFGRSPFRNNMYDKFLESVLKEVKEGWRLKEGSKRTWHIFFGYCKFFLGR